MQAGRLRHRVTIQQEAVIKGALGGQAKSWVDVVTVWEAVEPIRGREFFAAQQVNSEVTHRVTIRYRTGVTAKMRLVFQGRVLDISAPPIDVEERHRDLQLMCIERGAA
jgi:SPP1 family predicted phage head-tail adaptor